MATDVRLGKPRRRAGRFLFRVLRAIVLAILFAFLGGFAIGTCLGRDLDEPVRYYGALHGPDAGTSGVPS